MQSAIKVTPEQEIAQAVLSALPAGAARLVRDDSESLRYSVNATGLKLTSIVLRKESLRSLLADPARDIKVEYLTRDIARSAKRRTTYSYPRTARLPIRFKVRRGALIGLAPAH